MRQSWYNFVSSYSQISTSSVAKSWCWDHFYRLFNSSAKHYNNCVQLHPTSHVSTIFLLIHFIFCILDITFSAHGKGTSAFSITMHVPLENMGQYHLWDRVYLLAFFFLTIKNFSLRTLGSLLKYYLNGKVLSICKNKMPQFCIPEVCLMVHQYKEGRIKSVLVQKCEWL